jgi:hypothetical protein
MLLLPGGACVEKPDDFFELVRFVRAHFGIRIPSPDQPEELRAYFKRPELFEARLQCGSPELGLKKLDDD